MNFKPTKSKTVLTIIVLIFSAFYIYVSSQTVCEIICDDEVGLPCPPCATPQYGLFHILATILIPAIFYSIYSLIQLKSR